MGRTYGFCGRYVLVTVRLRLADACLNDVDDVVCEFLTLVYHVDVHCGEGVAVGVVVDVGDVLRLEVVAHVVDGAFEGEA